MVLKRIRLAIEPTIKSIEGDIYKVNRDRVIIGLANWMASKKLNQLILFIEAASEKNNSN